MFLFWVWLVLSYTSGALPWSVWLGKRFFGRDPRQQRDGNPGAANAFRSAGWRLGVPVLVLDFFKALLPVAAAHWLLRFPDQQLLAVSCMPSLGHAFSVFLGLRGGRGIVSMFGVWAALTLYQIPLVMGLTATLGVVLLKNDDVRTLAIPAVLILYLLLAHAPGWMVLLALIQLLIFGVKIATFLAQRCGHSQKGLR
jgi:glycerol-3-phosphate acyltransferase PlsY